MAANDLQVVTGSAGGTRELVILLVQRRTIDGQPAVRVTHGVRQVLLLVREARVVVLVLNAGVSGLSYSNYCPE